MRKVLIIMAIGFGPYHAMPGFAGEDAKLSTYQQLLTEANNRLADAIKAGQDEHAKVETLTKERDDLKAQLEKK